LNDLSFEEKRDYLNRYPWSSYPDYVSSCRHGFLSPEQILAYFRDNKDSYKTFVEEGISESLNPLEKGRGHGIIGDASFIRNTLKNLKGVNSREQPAMRRMINKTAPDMIIKIIAERFRVLPQEIIHKNYKGPARSVAMELLYRYAGMNQREIGAMMGVDYSSVSVARKRLQESLMRDRALKKRFKALEDSLSHG
jgi:hypothetical protein